MAAQVQHIKELGATVWSADQESDEFYLTQERNGRRSTARLESTTLKEAVEEAKEVLK